MGRCPVVAPFEELFVLLLEHFQSPAFEGIDDIDYDLVPLERLDEIAICPQLHFADSRGAIVNACGHNDGNIGKAAPYKLPKLHPGGDRHHNIQNHEINITVHEIALRFRGR